MMRVHTWTGTLNLKKIEKRGRLFQDFYLRVKVLLSHISTICHAPVS